jgi:serine/threonine-protein kinase
MTPDGKQLAVGLIGGTDIGVIRLDDQQREVVPLITGPGTQGNADISPDGRWIAYQSAESGQFQIYVRPFPNVDSGRWQVSSSGGVKPVWSRNGHELFYDGARNGTMMAVPVQTATTFSFETPIKLFEGAYYARTAGRTYDVAPDGKRFLMIKGGPGNQSGIPTSVVLVLNWFDDLRQRTTAR